MLASSYICDLPTYAERCRLTPELTGQQSQTKAISHGTPSPRARQILELVGSKPSLSRISLVGNSLGGLYVRYAAKLLYSNGDAGRPGGGATIAGLKPSVFMTIACPHLGVRRFTYVPLPSMLHSLAGVFVGRTGADLFLSRSSSSASAAAATAVNSTGGGGASEIVPPPPSPPSPSESPSTRAGGSSGSIEGNVVGAGDGETAGGDGGGTRNGAGRARGERESILLYSMGTSEQFLRPLKAFRWRRAYANRRGDFMVPYGTAAFLEPNEGDGSEAPVAEGGGGGDAGAQGPLAPAGADMRTGVAAAASASAAPSAPAVRVGTESFTLADRLLGAKNGAIVGFSRVGPAAPGTSAVASLVASGGQGEPAQNGGRAAISARIRGPAAQQAVAGRRKDNERRSMEEEMAAGLNSCGWEKVIRVF